MALPVPCGQQTTCQSTGGQANLSGTACQHVALQNRVTLPDAATEPSLAIQFTYGASAVGSATNTQLHVSLSGQDIAHLPIGPSVVHRVCVPSTLRGAILDLAFTTNSGGGACADTWSGTLDDVSLVSDPACNESVVMDPDLDGVVPIGGVSPWWIERDGLGPDPVLGTAGGQSGGYAQLGMGYPCTFSSIAQLVTAPVGSLANGGPALAFWHSLDSDVNGSYTVCTSNACTPLPVTVGWEQSTHCLPPSLSGKPVWIEFGAFGGGGTCASPYAQENLGIDSVALVLDPSCPW